MRLTRVVSGVAAESTGTLSVFDAKQARTGVASVGGGCLHTPAGVAGDADAERAGVRLPPGSPVTPSHSSLFRTGVEGRGPVSERLRRVRTRD